MGRGEDLKIKCPFAADGWCDRKCMNYSFAFMLHFINISVLEKWIAKGIKREEATKDLNKINGQYIGTFASTMGYEETNCRLGIR